MPWSFHSCTPDSGGKQILITNTCAYDTVLMALYWLRKYDKTLGPIIRDEGELLNVVLDNIERKNHAEARLAWISHCEQCNAATVARNYDPEDTRTAIKWNCDGMVTDCIKPMSMFKMKVEHIFEPCSQGDACPNLNLNGGTHKGTHHLIYASMKDMHQIQQEQIDKCYHSGVDMKCGEEIGSCINVDTNCDEVPARSACKGVRKMRKDIETLPPVVMIQNDDLDYNNCKVNCMNDIERRLLIQGKYYLLIQVNLYGGPRHFRGITEVENGRYIMYDGIASFGKSKKRVKYINGKTLFNTGRGNDYYASNLWYKKEDLPKNPRNTPTKLWAEDKELEEKEDAEVTERARVQYWVRRPKDNYKHHPSYLSLIQKYGQAPGGYWLLQSWKGMEECTALYRSYIANGKKLPDITVTSSTDLEVEEQPESHVAPDYNTALEAGNPDDIDMGEEKSNDGSIDIDRFLMSDLDTTKLEVVGLPESHVAHEPGGG